MQSMETPKYEVAVELLDWAITAFLSGTGLYAAIHLAGAAEEVFAVYLKAPEHKLTPAIDSIASLFLHISLPKDELERAQLEKWVKDRMNEPLNSVKHKRGHGDRTVSFDAEEEATDTIDRAISNYTQLLGKLPLRHLPAIDDFERARRVKINS